MLLERLGLRPRPAPERGALPFHPPRPPRRCLPAGLQRGPGHRTGGSVHRQVVLAARATDTGNP